MHGRPARALPVFAASALSDVLKPLLGGQPIYVLVVGGASFVLAGVLALRVR